MGRNEGDGVMERKVKGDGGDGVMEGRVRREEDGRVIPCQFNQ